jgi:hypothetical protein
MNMTEPTNGTTPNGTPAHTGETADRRRPFNRNRVAMVLLDHTVPIVQVKSVLEATHAAMVPLAHLPETLTSAARSAADQTNVVVV